MKQVINDCENPEWEDFFDEILTVIADVLTNTSFVLPNAVRCDLQKQCSESM